MRAHGGEIEEFTSAESYGIGVRVVLDQRVGFAPAGSLDEAVVREVLADARDNAGFAEADEWAGVAEPDGVEAVAIDLWRPLFADFPTDRKLQLAIDLERAVLASDLRINMPAPAYGDSAMRPPWRPRRASPSGRGDDLLAVDPGAGGRRCSTQTGPGLSVGRDPAELDLTEAATDAVERATRLLGARKTQSPAAAPPRTEDGVDRARPGGRHPDRRTRREGPIPVRRARRRADRLAVVDARRRPDRPSSPAPDSHDGEGLATSGTCSSTPGCCRASCSTATRGAGWGGLTGSAAAAGRRPNLASRRWRSRQGRAISPR